MNATDLIAQLQQLREFKVVVGHITFIGECPAYARLMGIMDNFKEIDTDAEMAAISITDWEGVTEADVLPEGNPEKLIPFDKALFRYLVYDRPFWWKPISAKLTELVMKRQFKKEAEIKNLLAGTMPKPSKRSRKPRV